MSFSWRGLLGVGGSNNGGSGSSSGGGTIIGSTSMTGSTAHGTLLHGLSSLPYGVNLSTYDLVEIERLADLPPMLGMENVRPKRRRRAVEDKLLP